MPADAVHNPRCASQSVRQNASSSRSLPGGYAGVHQLLAVQLSLMICGVTEKGEQGAKAIWILRAIATFMVGLDDVKLSARITRPVALFAEVVDRRRPRLKLIEPRVSMAPPPSRAHRTRTEISMGVFQAVRE